MKSFFYLNFLFLIFFGFSLQAQECTEASLLYEDLTAIQERLEPQQSSKSRLDSIMIQVKVVKVKDGDTAEILYHDFYMDVRFEHIDAPEIRGGQAFSQASRRHLLKRIEGDTVWLLTTRKLNGGFGRILGTIYTKEGLNVNKEMVAQGLAWHYKEHSKDASYKKLEKCARKNKIGLWKDQKTIAPWNWRKGKR